VKKNQFKKLVKVKNIVIKIKGINLERKKTMEGKVVQKNLKNDLKQNK